jgi:hypothetical protein
MLGRNCLALLVLVDGRGTVVASETTLFYQDELGGGLNGWGRFLRFAMILWAKKSGVRPSDLYTRWENGRWC